MSTHRKKRALKNSRKSPKARVMVRVASEPPKKGGILAALRRSPLVGSGLDVHRPVVRGRKIDL